MKLRKNEYKNENKEIFCMKKICLRDLMKIYLVL